MGLSSQLQIVLCIDGEFRIAGINQCTCFLGPKSRQGITGLYYASLWLLVLSENVLIILGSRVDTKGNLLVPRSCAVCLFVVYKNVLGLAAELVLC